ncbi:DNA polymerase III subunit epsilon [Candidatus Steffania adelgidicola]|uniref:DNA polymerase III subunit epsilon n=1 Tax=Candidatus Steffania adelgidicola TaxID=1076626 RepID=UPI001D027F0E|nr:DNA polymerase III subunit epsilon [Candidatus Steffania adelgidicola]UDG80223.1 DNA polymerase III subunit epsilon [Candidatus Steffania adelgidicola]
MSTDIIRQIVLDTETTGINKLGIHYEGHRIIEIGAVEIINRRLTGKHFHVYLKPDRLIDSEAFDVHGINDAFLVDKPTFSEVADELLNFILGCELVIHNAPFDIGFMNYEFEMLNRGIAKIDTFCKVTDTLLLAQKIFPGKRNSLDALCDRYSINNTKRTFHGALLDASILTDVFLLMTGGQTTMKFSMKEEPWSKIEDETPKIQRIQQIREPLKVILAKTDEILAHEQQLDLIQKKGGRCLWRIKKPKKIK